MSDGITEAYRAGRAADSFEKIWTEAQVERILLDIKSDVEALSMQELMLKLVDETEGFRVTHDDGWLVKYEWGTCFQTSIETKYAKSFPKVRQYKLEVSDRLYRSYKGTDLTLLMKEALVFVEWCGTEEGKRAVEMYNRY